MTRSLTYVEIDVDFCANTYGVAPCNAVLGVSGSIKCFNTTSTCQARTKFINSPVTLRYGLDVGYLPREIECIPSLQAVSLTPLTISLGQNLGIRATVTATFADHRHSDTGAGYDKYVSERGYDPFKRGTYWGKFRSRQKYLHWRPMRVIRGTLGQTLEEMETRHYLIEEFDGPDATGLFTIIAKDVLKQLDGSTSQAPRLSNGSLLSNIAIGDTTATLTPSGIGNAEYDAGGFIAIGGQEICLFSRVNDTLTLTRAQKNTLAVAHNAGDRVQLCMVFSPLDPADIIRFLLVTYASVPSDYINLLDWQTEVSSYLSQLYSACIADPVDVNVLVSELIEQAALALWWDDLNQKIRLQVLRAIPTNATALDETNVLENSFQIKDQSALRVTEVWTYYGQINPLLAVDRVDNYRSTLATVALQTESDYGASAIKTIYSRWIPAFGSQIAERVNDIQIARYKQPPRNITLELHRYGDVTPELGVGYNMGSWVLQDDTGERATIPVQITRLNALNDRYQIEAEEALFDDSEATTPDLTQRVITIDGNINNINLRTIHDSLYPAPVEGASPTVHVTCIIPTGVIVGSSSTSSPAFDLGSWPSDIPITIDLRGRIQGNGGNGGNGNNTGQTGSNGGPALVLARAVLMIYGASAQIWAGGGGGAGSNFAFTGSKRGAAAGGGGAGSNPGLGGTGSGAVSAAQNGTPDAGGAGGVFTYTGGGPAKGGDGGGPGLDGQTNAVVAPFYPPGTRGVAINGNSNITVISGSCDIRGTVV